jgi:hypothetical protein
MTPADEQARRETQADQDDRRHEEEPRANEARATGVLVSSTRVGNLARCGAYEAGADLRGPGRIAA